MEHVTPRFGAQVLAVRGGFRARGFAAPIGWAGLEVGRLLAVRFQRAKIGLTARIMLAARVARMAYACGLPQDVENTKISRPPMARLCRTVDVGDRRKDQPG
jgi:hypothetical protein